MTWSPLSKSVGPNSLPAPRRLSAARSNDISQRSRYFKEAEDYANGRSAFPSAPFFLVSCLKKRANFFIARLTEVAVVDPDRVERLRHQHADNVVGLGSQGSARLGRTHGDGRRRCEPLPIGATRGWPRTR